MASRPPWTHVNRSTSSSLAGMEIGIPPGHSYNDPALPPPTSLEAYGTRPLPPIPARRSMASSLSSELDKAIMTPKRSIDYHDHRFDVETNTSAVGYHPTNIAMGTDITLSTPPDEILSPQPRTSVPKILRLTGSSNAYVGPNARSPTGHNSSQKIQQLMGLDTSVSSRVDYKRMSSGSHLTDGVSPLSLMSGSTNLQDPDSVSELEVDLGYSGSFVSGSSEHSKEALSRNSSGRRSPGSIPVALRIRKSSHRYSEPPLRSPVEMDPYHAVTAQIARSTQDCGSFPYGPTEAALARHERTGADKSLPFSTSSDSKDGFSHKTKRTRVRVAPPPLLLRSTGGGGGQSFPAGTHPIKTPYPPANASVFESDTEDEEDEPSKLAKFFKRRSGNVAEITSSSLALALATSTTGPAAATQLERVVVSNRSRKADGPDTPMPPASMLQKTGGQLQGLVAQAKKSTGFLSKSDRKRDSLKTKIKVLPDGEGF